ncbi:hypothetical protein [Ilumatobacter sp.]|uniref:hypothetical protein n=1 Tax=Ilumatobacter sp. TaxID=1967498 RepID=UPI003B5174C7
MEIGFIAHAARRFWWLVAAFFLLGLEGGILASPVTANTYTAVGLLNVSPPSGSFETSSDRYIASQIVILRSGALATSVATDPSVQLSPGAIREAVTFTQLIGTDVVEVKATTGSPERAEAIASLYLDLYFDTVRQQLDDARRPEIDAIDSAISNVEEQLSEVDDAVGRALDEFVQTGDREIPTIDQVDPQLATARSSLIEQYGSLLQNRSDLALGQDSRITSQVIQRPTVPERPDAAPRSLLLVVGPIFGLLVGLTAATIAARLSTRVLGAEEAEEILGTAFVGEIARHNDLNAPLSEVIQRNHEISSPVIDQLCIRAEAHAPAGSSFVVLVTGTERTAGTSTIAAMMAANFANSGRVVTLIDGNTGNPALSRPLTASLGSLVALDGPGDEHDSGRTRASRWFDQTPIDNLRVIGSVNAAERGVQVANVLDVADAARDGADVVVFDGGPLMGAASTVQLSRTADAVVLAVPVHRQRSEPLRTVARQLRLSSGTVLPVVTPKLRSRRSGDTEEPSEAALREAV